MTPTISREEAWARIAPHTAPLETVRLRLELAAGRVLAEDVVCRIDIPGFDRSAMDGYAVRASDTPGRLRVAGEVAAGAGAFTPLESGTTQRIFTGGAIPPGADAVQRQEDVRDLGDGIVELADPVPVGHHIRLRGEDVAAGSVLRHAGTAITPQVLNVIAASGLGEVTVHRQARVGVLLTGDELVPPGQPLGPGQIYETSGVTLRTLARRAGAEVVDLGTARDDLEATTAAVKLGLDTCDVLLVAGGVSVGEHDHVKGALARAGVEELFWGVRVKPGKPLFCGRTEGGRWAFGLPGNPLSGFVGFLLFVEPLLRRMHGEPRAEVRFLPGRTTQPVGPEDGRTTFLTATFATGADGVIEATPTEQQGSAMTRALALADGFVIAPDGQGAIPAGGAVRVLPLSG